LSQRVKAFNNSSLLSSHQRSSQTFEGSAFIVLLPLNSLGLGLIDQLFNNLLVLQVVVKL